jgi:hypothetical protein
MILDQSRIFPGLYRCVGANAGMIQTRLEGIEKVERTGLRRHDLLDFGEIF